MSREKLQPGDLVKLCSGGPAMTIASVDGDHAKLIWFDSQGRLMREELPASVLTNEPYERKQ